MIDTAGRLHIDDALMEELQLIKREMQPVEKMSDKEIRARIDEAITKLSPEHRTAIVMREIDGLEYSEIAEQMDCSLGTVMSRLFYARKKLQALLKDVYETI